jgi:hypothetical protein
LNKVALLDDRENERSTTGRGRLPAQPCPVEPEVRRIPPWDEMGYHGRTWGVKGFGASRARPLNFFGLGQRLIEIVRILVPFLWKSLWIAVMPEWSTGSQRYLIL